MTDDASVPPLGRANLYETTDVLRFYNNTVTRHVAAAVIVSGAFPSEILNEIRAAFTHVAKGVVLEAGSPDYYDENINAMRHLKRVCLDCLKISILLVAERVDKDIDVLTNYTKLPQSEYAQAEELQKMRLAILHDEASAPSRISVDGLAELLVKYDAFLKHLRMEYGGHYAQASERKAQRNQQFWAMIGLSGGFVLGIAASLIASFVFPLLDASK